MASEPSPAPMAIMPLESASSPRSCRRRLSRRPTAAGLDHSARSADHTPMTTAIASTRMMKARNTLVSTMWSCHSTTIVPGRSASQCRPAAAARMTTQKGDETDHRLLSGGADLEPPSDALSWASTCAMA